MPHWAIVFVVLTVVNVALRGTAATQNNITQRKSGAFAIQESASRRPSVVMCTSELEHLTAGGAGVVVADSARALLRAGWRVLVVLDLEEGESNEPLTAWTRKAMREWSIQPHDAHALQAVRLSELANPTVPLNAPLALFLWHKSRQWSRALERIGHVSFDAVEFWDCGAPAYHALLLRRLISGPRSQHRIWIRTHGLHQAIVDHSRGLETLDVAYRMETRALQMADAVIANSPGTGRAYQHDHGLNPSRIFVIPPTLGTMKASGRHDLASPTPSGQRLNRRPSQNHNVLVYGKLQRVKGPDIAAKALVRAMRELAGAWRGSVIFAGDDMPCDAQPAIRMSACIRSSTIPPDLQSRFRFVGRVRRGTLGRFAAQEGIRFVILPSRYETFCLAAHEAAYFKLPVVLPRLPAYDGYFVDGKNAFTFSGHSAEELARVVISLILDDECLDNMAQNSSSILYQDPAEGYQHLLDGVG